MIRSHRVVSSLLGLLLTGCPSPQLFTLTDAGTGAPNSQPLWNLSLGYLGPNGVVDGVVKSVHGPLLRQTKGSTYGLWMSKPDGIYFAGDQDVGLLATPLLWVPKEVRLGMSWAVGNIDNKPDLEFTVVSHDEAGGSWKILRHDPQGVADDQVQTFSESLAAQGTRVFAGAADRYGPLGHQDLTLEEKPLRDGYVGSLNPGMVRVGSAPGVLQGPRFPGGEFGLCELVDLDGKRPEDPPQANGPFATTEGAACLKSAKCATRMSSNGGVSRVCESVPSGRAEAAYVHADGKVTWMPPQNTSTSKKVLSNEGSIDGHIVVPWGLVKTPDGQLRLMYQISRSPPFDSIFSLDADILARNEWANFPDQLRNKQITSETPQVGFPEASGETAWLMMRESSGGLLSLSVTRTSWLAQPIRPPAGSLGPSILGDLLPREREEVFTEGEHVVLGGVLSVLQTEAGPEVLHVSPDGEVNRLVIPPGSFQVHRQPVARAKVPPKQVAVGAWRMKDAAGDRLMLATVSVEGGYLVQHLFVSKETLKTPGAPERFPLEMRVSAQRFGAGTALCWEPGAAVDLSTWRKPDGSAAKPLPQGDSCALVVDTAAIEGEFPEIGRAFLSAGDERAPGETGDKKARLAGGGFVTPKQLLGPYSFPLHRAPQHSELWNGGGVVDLKGAGLWSITADGELLRLSRKSLHLLPPSGAKVVDVVAMGSGGVAVKDAAGAWFRFKTDDTWSALPALAADFHLETVFADGAVCGVRGTYDPYRVQRSWQCVSAAGQQLVSAPWPDTPAITSTNTEATQATPLTTVQDGTVLVTSNKGHGPISLANAQGIRALPKRYPTLAGYTGVFSLVEVWANGRQFGFETALGMPGVNLVTLEFDSSGPLDVNFEDLGEEYVRGTEGLPPQ